MRLPTETAKYTNNEVFTTVSLPKAKGVDRNYIIMNDKDMITLVKDVERIVRGSLEYKQYIQFLKDEIDMTECAFFKNVNNKNKTSVSIEIHHEPFTLFDISLMVVQKWVDMGININPLLISDEVMALHYKNMVGLIPLAITPHQLVHDGKLFIPLQYVYGNYLALVEEYGPYMTKLEPILLEKIRLSKEIENPDTTILEKRFVYLEVDGFTLPQIITNDD